MINRSGIFINMPVVRIDTGRNNDNQSEKEKEKERQLERQMPRMRTGEKNRSEKILENALQSGLKKNSSQEFSNLPRPATIKNNKNEDDLHQDLKRKDISNREPDSKNTLKHEPASKDDLKHEPKIKDDFNHEKELTSPDLAGLHTLEELLHRRENPPSLSDILSMLETTDKKMKHDPVPEAKVKQDNAELSDTLCSLDFLGGYVSASAEMPVIRGQIMEVIESLRQQVTNRSSDVRVNIPLSQEGLVQLIGDSETQSSLNQDAAGHQTLVIEVTESTMSKIVSSPRRTETKDSNFNQDRKPGDDTLPLTVQRGV